VEEEATNSSSGLMVATSMASLSRKPPRAVQLIISKSDLLIGKSFIGYAASEMRIELVTEPEGLISV
jgi:hypothetical protein